MARPWSISWRGNFRFLSSDFATALQKRVRFNRHGLGTGSPPGYHSFNGALLLVSAHFLNSEVINTLEIPQFLEHHSKDETFLLYPIIIKPCSWKAVPWLRQALRQAQEALRAGLLRAGLGTSQGGGERCSRPGWVSSPQASPLQTPDSSFITHPSSFILRVWVYFTYTVLMLTNSLIP
jgi:hypothetical protein